VILFEEDTFNCAYFSETTHVARFARGVMVNRIGNVGERGHTIYDIS
jgi:hypothetical protein